MEKMWTKEQLRSLIKDNNLKTADDAQKILKDLFRDTLQEMLEAEMDTDLGYEKHEKAGKSGDNRRNGHTVKKVRSEYGEIDLSVPRDRNGVFEPVVVPKHKKNVTGIEDQILALYAKGVTTREIQDHLKQLYGIEVSPTLISNVTGKILPLVKEWQNRPLQRVYAVVFLDDIHFKPTRRTTTGASPSTQEGKNPERGWSGMLGNQWLDSGLHIRPAVFRHVLVIRLFHDMSLHYFPQCTLLPKVLSIHFNPQFP